VVLQMDCSLLDKNIFRKRQILGNTFIMNEPSSQLGTPRSPPLQLGPLFDRPRLGGVVVVEISSPSLSSTAVPSSVFVFNFGLPRSRSDADGGVDVEMAKEEGEVGEGGCSLEEGWRYLSSCRVKGRVSQPSWNKDNGDWSPKKWGMGTHHRAPCEI